MTLLTPGSLHSVSNAAHLQDLRQARSVVNVTRRERDVSQRRPSPLGFLEAGAGAAGDRDMQEVTIALRAPAAQLVFTANMTLRMGANATFAFRRLLGLQG
jgi:hypothetical protein